MSGSHRLGELQYEIMRVLWRRREATAVEVLEELPEDHRRAPTTISTMLTKLEKKGAVSHRNEGRTFVYRPEIVESDVQATMIGDLTQRLFRGDAAALASHLISEREIDPGDLQRLQELIEQRRQNRSEGDAS